MFFKEALYSPAYGLNFMLSLKVFCMFFEANKELLFVQGLKREQNGLLSFSKLLNRKLKVFEALGCVLES